MRSPQGTPTTVPPPRSSTSADDPRTRTAAALTSRNRRSAGTWRARDGEPHSGATCPGGRYDVDA
jgi:hypothetical protein